LDLIRNRGRVKKEEAANALGVSEDEAERIFTTLHHMDLLKGQQEGETIYWTSMN
jgi:Mn-dependent DtxR family transcriptional regulator